MKVASPRMKWSEGKKAIVASGSRRADPVRGVEDAGRGAPVARLHQDVRRLRGAGELPAMCPVWARTVTTTVRDDRHAERHPIERLAQQAARPEQRDVLLGPLVAEHAPDQGTQARSLAAREHDGPRVTRGAHPGATR